MSTQTRTQDAVHDDIVAALVAETPDPARLSALWYEMGRVTAADRSVPGWAQMAAMTLGDRYAADARQEEQ